MKVFLDMDGVIADFVGAIHKAHGREYCYADPEARGQFEIEPIWGVTPQEFWSKDSYELWAEMNVTPEAVDIVSILESAFGSENIAILTSPSMGPGSVPGKREWMRRHFPQFEKRMIFTNAKEFLAGPNRLLVDDRDKNIVDFYGAGGECILIPRHWNSCHADADRVVARLRGAVGYGVRP